MNTFCCERCNHLDESNAPGADGFSFICSECNSGEWHHIFSKVEYNPSIHKGLLNRPDEGEIDVPSFG